MRKSELIARVLLNGGFYNSLQEAEFMVRKTFEVNFKGDDYQSWNTIVPNGQAVVDNIGRQTMVNVEKFIKDLWE